MSVMLIGMPYSIAQEANEVPATIALEFYHKAYVENFNPKIVFPSLLSMKFTDFNYAVYYVIATFVQQPWVILNIQQQEYVQSIEQRALLREYCNLYHQFFKQLFIKQDTHIVLYTVFQSAQKDHYNLFDFLKQQKYPLFAHFYAFYFDLLSASYIEKINQGYKVCDTAEYTTIRKEISNVLHTMGTIFSHYLKNTIYENRYAQHIKSYGQVYNLLQFEHKKMVEA